MARLTVAAAGCLPTATRGSQSSYTTSGTRPLYAAVRLAVVDAIRATKISLIDSRRASPISNRSSSRIEDGPCCRLTPRLGVRVVAY